MIVLCSFNFWAAVSAFALLSCSTVHVIALFYNCFIEQINEWMNEWMSCCVTWCLQNATELTEVSRDSELKELIGSLQMTVSQLLVWRSAGSCQTPSTRHVVRCPTVCRHMLASMICWLASDWIMLQCCLTVSCHCYLSTEFHRWNLHRQRCSSSTVHIRRRKLAICPHNVWLSSCHRSMTLDDLELL